MRSSQRNALKHRITMYNHSKTVPKCTWNLKDAGSPVMNQMSSNRFLRTMAANGQTLTVMQKGVRMHLSTKTTMLGEASSKHHIVVCSNIKGLRNSLKMISRKVNLYISFWSFIFENRRHITIEFRVTILNRRHITFISPKAHHHWVQWCTL